MPTPATATPAGRSHIAPRRSDQRPKSGWISDDEACDARMTAPTAVYESEKRSFRNGSSAGKAPFEKSVAKCPLDSSAIARRSISARTAAGYREGLGSLNGQVALDQRVRELPLSARQLDAIPLELRCVDAALAEPLPLGGQTGDLLEQRLDGVVRAPTPEARGCCRPQNGAHGRGHHRHPTDKVESG